MYGCSCFLFCKEYCACSCHDILPKDYKLDIFKPKPIEPPTVNIARVIYLSTYKWAIAQGMTKQTAVEFSTMRPEDKPNVEVEVISPILYKIGEHA